PVRELTGDEPKLSANRYTENFEAYQLYVKGHFFWDKRTEEGIKKSIEYFERAIRLDPNYALAYAGLATSYVTTAYREMVPAPEPRRRRGRRSRSMNSSARPIPHWAFCIFAIWNGRKASENSGGQLNSTRAIRPPTCGIHTI